MIVFEVRVISHALQVGLCGGINGIFVNMTNIPCLYCCFILVI